MSDVVLVTGGTGKTGRYVVSMLEARGVAVRVASRGANPAFDWDSPESWEAALVDVQAVYLIAPNSVEDPFTKMTKFIDFALSKGVKRFVFLSMSALPAGGPAHGQVHQYLFDHCTEWTVLCPTAFMQNFSEGPYLEPIQKEDSIYSNTDLGRTPFIHIEDIAACAVEALVSPVSFNSEFILTGKDLLSYDQVADLISLACVRKISHVKVTSEAMVARYMQRGIPEETAKLLALGYEWIAGGGEDRLTTAVFDLTGREPKGFREFAEDNAEVWAKAAR